jgi:hypothetical protein
MEPETLDERSKKAVRWLIIIILLTALLFFARYAQS